MKFVPAYLRLWETDRAKIHQKVERALAGLRRCRVCPRNCDVNRVEDRTAVCRTGRYARVSSAFAHFGEEDCLRGRNGSGTIFFAFCNLKCVFCQNHDLSWEGEGASECPPQDLAMLMARLQAQGCHNINLVTPEHVVPQIVEAIPHAIEMGLRVPIVYNTGTYDSAESLDLVDGIVDIYMPDFKFWEPAVSKRLLAAEDYPEVARARIVEMHRQVGDLAIEDGLARRGILLRHLVMPGGLAGTREIMRFLAHEVSPDTYVNLMDQYRPAGRVLRKPDLYRDIGRGVTDREMGEAYAVAREEGIHRFDKQRCAR